MSAAVSGTRRALVAKLQIAKKEMGLDDPTYRDLLTRVTGRDSSTKCTEPQLVAVVEECRRLGWQAKPSRPISADPQVRKIYAIWRDIKKLLDGTAGDAQLRAFVRRQTVSPLHPEGVAAAEFLNAEQANLVIEGLKGWLRNLERAAA